jgi:hypothetical protein
MTKKFGVVHVLANCDDCDWEAPNHKNGIAISAIHAKTHGHKVHVEIVTDGYFDGRVIEEG